MPARAFDAVLIRPEGVGTWTFVSIPFNVEDAYGARGQVKVRGAVNGQPYRGSAMPQGDGSHYLVVNKALRDAAGVTTGDTVHVEMEPDTEVRQVEIPTDLRAAVDADPAAREAFDRFSYSHQKAYVEWIQEARATATRQRRIARAVEMLAGGKHLK
jgi:hypothetical protein